MATPFTTRAATLVTEARLHRQTRTLPAMSPASRVCLTGWRQLTIRINGKYHLNIIQAYLPTSSHDDQEVENVYEDIDNLITNSKAHYNVIMGDFNAKVGLEDPAKSCIGPYGLGARNTRGDSLINFAESHQPKIMNTFFKKRLHRRWTWISPNGITRNEIDYILTDKPQLSRMCP